MLRHAILQQDLDMAMHRVDIDAELGQAELDDLLPEQINMMMGLPHRKDQERHEAQPE